MVVRIGGVFEWGSGLLVQALLAPRLPLLVDGTRVQTVSSVENLWLAATAPDVPRAWPPRWLLRCESWIGRVWRASPSPPERTGSCSRGATCARARKNQLLVSYRPLARFCARRASGHTRALPGKVLGSFVSDPTASSALREL